MKKSEKPTGFVLVQAQVENNDLDSCEFALIHISNAWVRDQRKRMELAKAFKGDHYFQYLVYYDVDVSFHVTDDEGQPDIPRLLDGRDWAFVELDADEAGALGTPEENRDCHRILIRSDGSGFYKAYGKYSGIEFFTSDVSWKAICDAYENRTSGIDNKNSQQ